MSYSGSSRPTSGNRNTAARTSSQSPSRNVARPPILRSCTPPPQTHPTSSVDRASSQSSTSPLSTSSSRFRGNHAIPPRANNGPSLGENQAPVQNHNTFSGNSDAIMRSPQRSYPIIQNKNGDWISRQDRKIKASRLPKNVRMRDVYAFFSRYGKIVRIEKSADAAFVTYQPPPQIHMPPNHVFIRGARVQIDDASIRRFPVSSPVNPKRQYHEANIMFANSIDFGVTLAEKTLDIMRTVEAKQKIQVTLSLGDRKELDFQFPFTIDEDVRHLRFRLPLSLVERVFCIETPETGKYALVIPFNSPPQFFLQSKTKDILNTFNEKEKVWLDWYTWYRQTDITDAKTSERLTKMPVMNHHDEMMIDIGRWTTYRVTFDLAAVRGPQFKDLIDGLSDHGVHVQVLDDYHTREGRASPMESLVEDEIFGTHPELAPSTAQNSTSGELFTSRIHLKFSVRYQLEACLSNNWIKEHSITREFLERLNSMDPEEAVCLLEKVADRQHTYLDPMQIFQSRRKLVPKTIPNYCVFSRSANITPTMIHVGTPVVETSNRIIRKHAADAERFIRVKFSDEQTEGRLFSSENDRSNAVFEKIERAMRQGIVVAGRHYEFLAFGNSQFREHGAYFYAPTPSQSPNDIRQSMGQFEHIKTAAKYGARLGQCFSTTRAIKSINVKIERIPDIQRNGFVFTDGVGRISPFLAQMAAQELGLQNPFENPPSLYQFRLGGCKGVLALDPTINGSIVHIRPSQYKFEAQNVGLEIIRASALAVACFNRQLIIILSALGVPDTMFIRKQQEMVNYLERATKEEKVALEKLQRNIDLNQTSLTMAGMILDGFMKHGDPFMVSLLQLWRAYNIKYLKEKARIVIENGAFVLGCVDESATLRGHFEDPQSRADATREEKLATLPEIFLQISDSDGNGYKIIEGICILARNPSLHCGDIRVVRAVNVPALHHLKNVVVLPQTGDRDLANMCSGGDLDGDDYIVLWDSSFIPTIINENPMDFTPEKPVESDRPITVQDITDFFVTYIKTDTLSRIATAHLAQADAKAEGVRDETCLELAKLHSQAVDYPKSGIPATMSRDLRPKKYPHFMESKQRPAHKTYKSKKVLGMLYDQVELVDFKPVYGPFDDRILHAFQLDDAVLETALNIKSSYDSSVRRLMAKHAIKTEFEVWSIFVLSHNLESRDYTFAEEFGKTVSILKEQYRDMCREAVRDNQYDMDKFIVAMYTVTSKEVESARMECGQVKTVGGSVIPVRTTDNMPLMSFPWLFVSDLGRIATSGFQDERRQRLIQPVMKASRKGHAGLDPESKMSSGGDIETAEGVTHYGELLKLDFSQEN